MVSEQGLLKGYLLMSVHMTTKGDRLQTIRDELLV